MKTTVKLIAMIILLGAGSCLMTQKVHAHGGIYMQVFYDELKPYGTWVESPDYGYVWVPDVTPGFHPYGTSGYWVYTVYGWTWVSYYPWGWAPFHYGRWYYDNWYGWVWVPGTEWGPAWVSWRYFDGYYGWAPLTPGFCFSMTTNVYLNIPIYHWVFVPDRHFGRHDLDRYYMNRRDNDRIYHHSKMIENKVRDHHTNVMYFQGPEVKDVTKATGRQFKPVEVRSSERAGQSVRNGRMEVYRPETEGRSRIENYNHSSRQQNSIMERSVIPGSNSKYDGAYNKNQKKDKSAKPVYTSSDRMDYNSQPEVRTNSINRQADSMEHNAFRNNPRQNKDAQEKQSRSTRGGDRSKRY